MKTTLRKSLIVLIVLSATINSFAQSGTTGPLTWEIADGTLTISGTGEMPDYGHPWYDYQDLFQQIIISDGVTNIGDYAFELCNSLTVVTIPNSVTNIGRFAFYQCYNLTTVTIPDAVTNIGYYAFYNCHSLTTVTIPNSVTNIGNAAFSVCSSLISIDVDVANQHYSSESGVLYNKDKSILITYPAGKKEQFFSISNSVINIGDYAFTQCISLRSVTIGNSVTDIGEDAFAYCSSLSSVTIGNSVTNIGDFAFVYCISLTAVTIPNSVTNIGRYAFSCSSLSSVTIGNSVTNIGGDAFADCHSLTTVTIPDLVTNIEDYTFYCCFNLTTVTIGNSVTDIGDAAFYECNFLTEINSKNPTPPNANFYGVDKEKGFSSFYDVDKEKCILYVPTGSVDLYKAHDGWKEFLHILEKDFTAIQTIDPGAEVSAYASEEGINIKGCRPNDPVSIYTLAGQRLYHAVAGNGLIKYPFRKGAAYIVSTPNKTLKVIF